MRPNAPLWFLNSNVSQGKQGLSGQSPRKWNGLDPAPFKGGRGGWGGGEGREEPIRTEPSRWRGLTDGPLTPERGPSGFTWPARVFLVLAMMSLSAPFL